MNGSNKIQPIGKTAIPIDMSPALADTSWRSTAELTTNMEIAVFQVEKVVFIVKNPGAYFTLSISANRSTYARCDSHGTEHLSAYCTISFVVEHTLVYKG